MLGDCQERQQGDAHPDRCLGHPPSSVLSASAPVIALRCSSIIRLATVDTSFGGSQDTNSF